MVPPPTVQLTQKKTRQDKGGLPYRRTVPMVEVFDVGPCSDSYQLGYLIGRRFAGVIRSRLSNDPILHNQLIPFSETLAGRALIAALSDNNRTRYPSYWSELRGTADGSAASVVHLILLNFRKEILPFLPGINSKVESTDDCSDILVVSESIAMAAHNEDANFSLIGHTYIVKASLANGRSFTAYTYAGELPSGAFGFNNKGLAFTLNSVPPSVQEVFPGGIGRNFVSRDLLEADDMDDALHKIKSSQVSVGHSYNLVDVKRRQILNVETASRSRVSVVEVGATPFFHANMYLHLQVDQVYDDNSVSRQQRADILPKTTKEDFLAMLGDTQDRRYPIYMTGPTLHTLCTALIDLDNKTLSIIEENPKDGRVSHVFSVLADD